MYCWNRCALRSDLGATHAECLMVSGRLFQIVRASYENKIFDHFLSLFGAKGFHTIQVGLPEAERKWQQGASIFNSSDKHSEPVPFAIEKHWEESLLCILCGVGSQ